MSRRIMKRNDTMKTEIPKIEFKVAVAGFTALAMLFGSVSFESGTAYADPPSWAPAHGWRDKHNKHHHDDDGGYVVYQPVPVYSGGNPLRCNGALAGAAIGGATGAVIGSEVGHGKGKVAVIAGGAILGVLLGAAVGQAIDDDDRACAGNAVAYGPVGQPVYWENPGAGITYQIVPERQYFMRGLPCREYTAKAKIGGRNQRIHGTACQQPDGSWQVAG